jgi:hypothetical protein
MKSKKMSKELKDSIIAVMVQFDTLLGNKSAKVQYRRGIITELHAMALLHGVCMTNSKLAYELSVNQFYKCVVEYLNTPQ